MKLLRVVIVVVVIVAVIGAAGYVVVKRRAAAGAKPTIVRVEEAQMGKLTEIVSAPGSIEPKINVEISAKTSGRIVELPYDEGDVVTKGNPSANPPVPASVVVRLDAKDMESLLLLAQADRAAGAAQMEVEKARIAGQEANLLGQEASLKQAERDLERYRELLASKDISQVTFDEAKLKVDDLRSRYEAAKYSLEAARLNLKVLGHNLEAADAAIDQAKESLSHTTITAPIDGTITRINAEVGEMVVTGMMNNPGTKILEIGDLSEMLVVAEVDEADVGKLEVGQRAGVYIDAYPDRRFDGTVYSIALSHDMSRTMTKYFRTEVLLEMTEQRLRSGLTAHVDIETRIHDGVLAVPSQAVMARELESLPLKTRDSSPYVDKSKTFATVVFRCQDGRAVITPVKIGPSNLTHTIIEGGVAEGDKIIIGPYKELEKLEHGQLIKDERETGAEG